MTTLANCIINGRLDMVQQYLLAGADINQFDEYGFTPLIEAAIANNIEIAKFLLERNADPNQKDMVGGTALHWAVENNNEELVRRLLDAGADSNSYNNYSEPAITKAVLRNQTELKDLLYQNGASSTFAYDYINLKLLGHRFDLHGSVDIVDAQGYFTELDFEGFIMEFSLSLLTYSVRQFSQNYAAKSLQNYFPLIKQVINALENAQSLIKYQQYLTDRNQNSAQIEALLEQELLILPVNFNGHTIAMIKYKNILAIIDRRQKDNALHGVCFYELTKPRMFTKQLMRHLLYAKKTDDYIYQTIPKELGLKLVGRLIMEPQMSGNCSWANLTATIPAALFLLTDDVKHHVNGLIDHDHFALSVFRQWRDWDMERALHYCLNSFDNAQPVRKASIASSLAAVMFQRLHHQDDHHVELARRILKILKQQDYYYVLDHYLRFYHRERKTKAGENLQKMLQRCEELF